MSPPRSGFCENENEQNEPPEDGFGLSELFLAKGYLKVLWYEYWPAQVEISELIEDMGLSDAHFKLFVAGIPHPPFEGTYSNILLDGPSLC